MKMELDPREAPEGSRMTAGLFSSRSDDWSTPPNVFDALDKEFNFGLDVCASKENAKCKLYYSKEVSAGRGQG
jgi:hypothetical protein